MVYHNYQIGHPSAKGVCSECKKTFKRQGPKQKRCRTCIGKHKGAKK